MELQNTSNTSERSSVKLAMGKCEMTFDLFTHDLLPPVLVVRVVL